MSAWNSDPVVLTVAVTGADVFRENNPNIPYTTEEIAELEHRGGRRRGHGRAPARARGRRHAERPAGAVRRRDRPDPRRLRPPDHGLDRRRQRHDDRGADDGPRGEARHLRGRVGLDELRRRDLHHAAARRAAGSSSGRSEAGIALEVEAFDVGHVVSAVRWLEQGILPPPLRINLVFGVPGGIDASPEALDAMLRPLPADAFWTVTCIGRHHPRMLGARRCSTAPRGSAPASRTSPTCAAGVLAPSNAALVEMAVGLTRHPRARGRHPGADQGAAAGLAERGVTAAEAPGADGRPSARRGPETRDAIDGAGDRALRAPRLPRDLDAGDRLGGRACSRRRSTTGTRARRRSWSQLQDDFMERLTEQGRRRRWARHGRPALRLAAAVREHVVFHGIHRREAFVTDSEIRALTEGPRRALIAKRDDYQAMFSEMIRDGIRDGSLRATDAHVATYAILLQCTGVALWFDPSGPLDARAGRRAPRRARARLAAGARAS